MEIVESLPEVAKCQREAGDFAAARVTLDRILKLVESLRDFSRVEELIQVTGTDQPRRENHETGAIVRCGLLTAVAEERQALGDRDDAGTIYQLAVEAIQPRKDVFQANVSRQNRQHDAQGGPRRSPQRD